MDNKKKNIKSVLLCDSKSQYESEQVQKRFRSIGNVVSETNVNILDSESN